MRNQKFLYYNYYCYTQVRNNFKIVVSTNIAETSLTIDGKKIPLFYLNYNKKCFKSFSFSLSLLHQVSCLSSIPDSPNKKSTIRAFASNLCSSPPSQRQALSNELEELAVQSRANVLDCIRRRHFKLKCKRTHTRKY